MDAFGFAMMQIAFCFVLGLPVACVAWTVTQEEIFRELQEFCKRHHARLCMDAHGRPRRLACRLAAKIFYLPTCAYCFSHYPTLALVLYADIRLGLTSWLGYLVALFGIVLAANFWVSTYNLLRAELRCAKARADYAERLAKG